MTPQTEAAELVLAHLKEKTGLHIPLSPLPENGGISAEITGSVNHGMNMDLMHGKEALTMLFLCKDLSQKTAYETMCRIGNAINGLTSIQGETVEVCGGNVRSGTGLVGMSGEFYIYSLIAEIKIFYI